MATMNCTNHPSMNEELLLTKYVHAVGSTSAMMMTLKVRLFILNGELNG
ncbi:hypothetical protein HQN89_35095 [Paenibacillus frigoriresistens]|nr:hypothetical protein [Paenibacillus frigoriresistens]